MIPIVVRSTEEMLRIVPNRLREASYALGVSKWRTIVKVVLPTALAGIVTGVMLAIARIIGETAPLLITTGVVTSVNAQPVRRPHVEPRRLRLQLSTSRPACRPSRRSTGRGRPRSTLILIVMVLNLLARLLYRRFGTELRE